MNIIIHHNEKAASIDMNKLTTDTYIKVVRKILDQSDLSIDDKKHLLNKVMSENLIDFNHNSK